MDLLWKQWDYPFNTLKDDNIIYVIKICDKINIIYYLFHTLLLFSLEDWLRRLLEWNAEERGKENLQSPALEPGREGSAAGAQSNIVVFSQLNTILR